jgi:hypothetical protein
MQLNVPPDLETLMNKRLSSGGYSDAKNASRCCRHTLEEGHLQAERGELIDEEQVRREMQDMKEEWRKADIFSI